MIQRIALPILFLLLGVAPVWAQGLREVLRRQAERIFGEAEAAAEQGNTQQSEELRRKAQAMVERARRMLAEERPETGEPVNPERFQAELEGMRREAQRLMREGRREEARRLEERIRRAEQEFGRPAPPPPGEDEEELRRRLEGLERAIRSLEEAGLPERAEQLRREADELRRQLGGFGPPQDLVRRIENLEQRMGRVEQGLERLIDLLERRPGRERP